MLISDLAGGVWGRKDRTCGYGAPSTRASARVQHPLPSLPQNGVGDEPGTCPPSSRPPCPGKSEHLLCFV